MTDTTKHQKLIIVESPAKARTIGRYLGPEFRVRASVGHIRDLPKRELGVDVENCFEPKYVTIRGKGKIIRDLKQEAIRAEEVILATDPDREGEAIAFHVAEQLGYGNSNGGGRFRRILFHEITKDAVRRALDEGGDIDMRKVEAQLARRTLDRLVGYLASPFLWKSIRPGLSAGRVQTVALRLITDREDEIRAFEPEEYWSITAELEKDRQKFEAKLHRIAGEKFKLGNESETMAVVEDIDGVPFIATSVKRRERRKNPSAPFTTSTLQQEAAKRLGFSAKQTMRVAQQLYEGVELGDEGAVGLITYMRTDSTRVSPGAAGQARGWAKGKFGDRYVPKGPRLWRGKQQKGAQEAHEAIRPTDGRREPSAIKRHLDRNQYRLYELIWLRFVASQMSPAVFDTTTVDFDLEGASGRRYVFRATGSIMKFDGFTRLYEETKEDDDGKSGKDKNLPDLKQNDDCRILGIVPAQHFTSPPPRYSEASLVKELEKDGIGRPSTYAQIISTIRDRGYVEMRKRRFRPTALGETVAKVLVRGFPSLFEVGFTSEMEGELDQIEGGDLQRCAVLDEFYGPFTEQLEQAKANADRIVREVVQTEDEECPECGRDLVVRWNKYGRFLGCSGYPECKHTKSLDERAEPEPIGDDCPECGSALVQRDGRYGPFVACSNYPDCKFTRPVTIPGLKCPRCGEGDIGEKRTRKGKPFWGCTRYPDCDWSSWDRPVPQPCPDCGADFLVQKSTKKRGKFLKCRRCKGEFEEASVAVAQEG